MFSIQKRLPLIIILLCVMALTPYFAACFYIHPFFDDFIFADQLLHLGKEAFIHHYYYDWTGRYTNIFLWALLNCKIEGTSNIQYVLFGISILLLLFLSLFYLVHALLKNTTTIFFKIQLVLIGFAFYLAFMPEIFSAYYWYDASYYQLDLAFVIFNIGLIIDSFNVQQNLRQKILLILVNIYIAGCSEIFVITTGFLYFVMIVNQYIRYKKIVSFWLLLILIFGLFASFNILSPGNFARATASESGNSFLFSSVRAFYDFVLFHVAYTCFKTPFLLLVLLTFPWAFNFIKSERTIVSILNVNPFFSVLSTLFIFYLHHALSVYAAGYSLQGRVIDFSILLFWISSYYNFLVILKCLFDKYSIVPIRINPISIKVGLVMLILLFSFSDNNRLLWGDLIRELPSFQQQLTERYELIGHAKKQGLDTIAVPEITANPKLYRLGDHARCSDYNFVNDPNYLKETAGYFKIVITKKE